MRDKQKRQKRTTQTAKREKKHVYLIHVKIEFRNIDFDSKERRRTSYRTSKQKKKKKLFCFHLKCILLR